MKLAALVLAIVVVLIVFAVRRSLPASAAPIKAPTAFVFVRIPEQIMPMDRGAKYEDPLDASLKREGLGEVTGGGTQLGKPDANGKKSIEWVGVDVELSDIEDGLTFLKAELRHLGAPSGTTLEFTRNGETVTERL